ncbi:MAG TPA: peptidase domain-containing ABC transporter [Allosphingosinicella sp.]|nr:peptidase domain-containing ABC transporter [Allosphingosinicella sp.]
MSIELLNLSGGHSVRTIRQSEVAECGLACLAMVANFHGSEVDLSALRRRFPITQRGLSLRDLIAIADKAGLAARPLKLPLEALPQLQLPAVLHWDLRHFVVLERATAKAILIHDPAAGRMWMPLPEASKHFTGVALEIRPAAGFAPIEERNRLRLSSLWTRAIGLKRAILQVLTLTVVLQVLALAGPYYMQVGIDAVMPAMDVDLLLLLAAGFMLLVLINAGTTMLRSLVLLQAGTSVSFQVGINLARKLFRLPIAFFERRQVGDILSRFSAIHPIREGLTTGVTAGVVDGGFAILTLAMMMVYSPLLTLVVVAAFLLYAGTRAALFAVQRRRNHEALIAGARESSTMIEAIRGVVTLRMFGRESERLAVWQNRLADATNAQLSSARLGAAQNAANVLIFGLENVIVVYLAISAALGGGFSLGMVFAFLAYKAQFVQRATAFVDNMVSLRMLGLHLERLGDIALETDDRSFAPQFDAYNELSGGIGVSDLRFRYGPTEPLVLTGVNLEVAEGEHVAITGPSGGGKSTLVKILLGLLEPDSGEIRIDGIPLHVFGYQSYRSQIAAVLQEDQLFSGSLADNIALFDPEPDQAWIEEVAGMAAIHDDIQAMPMRYHTLAGDGGSSLSGGQKQRILLARALYRKPKILLMDEGTAHLDAATESRVNACVAAMGITRIVIAHRTETIRNADRVLFLAHGQLQELDAGAFKPKIATAMQAA